MYNPAGPSAVRTPSFMLAGFMIFSLSEVHRQQFTLSKVKKTSFQLFFTAVAMKEY